MSLKNASSLYYKSTGVTHVTPEVSPVSPQRALDVAARNGISPDAFACLGLRSTVDPRIEDKAYRILGFIGGTSWKGPSPLSYEEIAESVNCSERSAQRHVASLEKLGLIIVQRRHNCRNEYLMVSEKKQASGSVATGCERCKVARALDRVGVCIICRKDERAEREVAEQLAAGFAEQTVIWANLKAHGSKCGAKEIGRAYLKLTVNNAGEVAA